MNISYTIKGLLIVSMTTLSACSQKPEQESDSHAKHNHADNAGHQHAEGAHDHAAQSESAPAEQPAQTVKKGRIITSVDPHLEFFLMPDRKIRIQAMDKDNQPQPMADQSVNVIGGSRMSPVSMSFQKRGNVLISDVTFPEGKNLPVVMQIQESPGSDMTIEQFNLNLNGCSSCANDEYACSCGHEDASTKTPDDHGHSHDHGHEGHSH